MYESSIKSEEGSGEEFCKLLCVCVCVTLGLAALCHVLHVFGNVVHVGDVRPLLRVRVDAHIYQVPQLVRGTGRGCWLGGKERNNTVSDTAVRPNRGFLKSNSRNEQTPANRDLPVIYYPLDELFP